MKLSNRAPYAFKQSREGNIIAKLNESTALQGIKPVSGDNPYFTQYSADSGFVKDDDLDLLMEELDQAADKVAKLLDQDKIQEAVELLKEEDLDLVENPDDPLPIEEGEDGEDLEVVVSECDEDSSDDDYDEDSEDKPVTIVLEKVVKTVSADGKVRKKKLRSRKAKRTSAQKNALKKARKKAKRSSAKKKRAKAMKIRSRKGMNESLASARLASALLPLLESEEGATPDDLKAKIEEVLPTVTESELTNEESDAVDILENRLRNRGAIVSDLTSRVEDGVILITALIKNNSEDISVTEIASDMEAALGTYDVTFSTESAVNGTELTVYISPREISESDDEDEVITNDAIQESWRSILARGRAILESDSTVIPAQDTENLEEGEDDDYDEDSGEDESEVHPKLESYIGGADNVKCAINPAYIKEGQYIAESSTATVFLAKEDATVSDLGEVKLAAELINTADEDLVDGLGGDKLVALDPDDEYLLLAGNPME